MDAVFEETGICATAGIGTNLFLAKVALDITAKHVPDHMGWLDEMAFKRQIWHHRPITDVWNIGAGIATRLKKYGIEDLFGVTQCDEDLLYREFGVNAELLIDHAWGREPCTIADIHAYKAKSNSLSNGQVLMEDYTYEEGLVVLKEMVHSLTLDLVEKGMVTNGVSLSIGYAHAARSHTGGSKTIPVYTNSHDSLWPVFLELYEKTTDRRYAIKRLNIGYNNIVGEEFATYDLLTDVEALQKENSLQKTLVGISKRYGKNAILRGVSFEDKATARERNKMIGGHRSGEDDQF
jgi:DNA polymerase V